MSAYIYLVAHKRAIRSCRANLFYDMDIYIFFCTVSAFSLYGEYVVHSFLPDGIFFYLVTTGWIFLSYVRIQSINQKLVHSY